MNTNSRKVKLPFLLFFAGICAGLLLWTGCSDTPVPKPKGYPRIELPAHEYQSYSTEDCPFTFDFPTYARIAKDTQYQKLQTEHPCWMNIEFPSLNAAIYLSYKEIDSKNSLLKLITDAEKMNSKHVRKADYIDDSVFVTRKGVLGIYYEVGGNAASSTQFLLTDSVEHFMWASLYFQEVPNEDSIAPVVKFVREDIDTLLHSFEWK